MTRNKKIAIAGGIILLIGVVFGTYQFLFSAPEKEFKIERFVVPLGSDITHDAERAVIHELKEKGFIRSEWAFKFVLKIKDWQIKPGAYKISKNMDVWILADTLFRFPYQKWVVIPEGLRKEEVAERAKKELGWSEETKEEFLANAEEGYLFPDTYLLQVLNFEDAGKIAAERMKNQFNEKVADLFKEAQENSIRNDTLIILASLVQREAANEDEMPIIAGVIWNRWLKDMPFQIDATVQYALGGPGNWWPIVKPEDYKLDSPYNTYVHKGRPPAPICNPGLAAIDAVINSEDSEYLYYLHDSEGQIHLAKTYEEHLKNIRDYFWESYKDARLGYEMKYPPTWLIVEKRENFGIELSRIVFQSKDYEERESEEYKARVEAGEETGLLQPTIMTEGIKLELLITEIPSDFKWQDWAKRATDYPYGKIVSERFVTLGKVYERQVESGEASSIVISFPDPEETKLFEPILHTLKKDKEKNLEILKQILSTFSFDKTFTEDIGNYREIKLYYYNQKRDREIAEYIPCDPEAVLPVSRKIFLSQTPIQDAVNLLLQGKVTQEEKEAGFSPMFPLEGVKLVGANLKDGVLTLEFEDPFNKTGGGSCRVRLLWAEVAKTAKQFPEVKEVRFLPEEIFQP